MLVIFKECAVPGTTSIANLTGSISKYVGLRDGSNLAKFHAFIIKVNNSAYFWTITAGLSMDVEVRTVGSLARSTNGIKK